MTAEILLSRLDRVRPTGKGRWAACCPAHEDRLPSLTITETPDGVVLFKCFAECSAESVLSAVGLQFSDLYPEKLDDHRKTERMPFNARDVLAAVSKESMLVFICATDIANGKVLTADERKRLLTAASRIRAAAEVCHAG